MSYPEFVYRIVDDADWLEAKSSGIVPYADLDERDGFFHLSTFCQLLDTADRYFTEASSLLALKIKFDLVKEYTKFESPARATVERYPHLYGHLEIAAIVAILTLEKADGGKFFVYESNPL